MKHKLIKLKDGYAIQTQQTAQIDTHEIETEAQAQVINITIGYLQDKGWNLKEIKEYTDYVYDNLEEL